MNKFANIAFVTLTFAGVVGAAQAADGLAQYAQRAVTPVTQSAPVAATQTEGMAQFAFRAVTPSKLDAAPSTQTAQTKAAVQKTSATGFAVYAQRAVTPVL
ncbi:MULTISPECIES: hypothetical protein [Silvimonas]|uniref:hypothetical protein n=1 Tax=Silvimonas TaxID=300264 RepID=UPI0024B3C383|nr:MULTISPECIES: hypothetical protein [Silvimonas]MDR3429304.1 hypothetical protein [Silvimonas sp.]